MNPSFWREAYDHFPGLTLLFEINAEGLIEPVFVSKRVDSLLGFSPPQYLDVLQEPSPISQGVNAALDILAKRVNEKPEGKIQSKLIDRYGKEKMFTCHYEMFRLKSGPKRFLRLTFMQGETEVSREDERVTETFAFESQAFIKVKQQVRQAVEQGQSVLVLSEEGCGSDDLVAAVFGVESNKLQGVFGMQRVHDRLTSSEKMLIFNLEKAGREDLEAIEERIIGQCFVVTSAIDMLTIWKKHRLSVDRLYKYLPVTVILPPLSVREADAESYFLYQLNKINAFLPQFKAAWAPDRGLSNKEKITNFLFEELRHYLTLKTSKELKGRDLFGNEELAKDIEPFDVHIKRYLQEVLEVTEGKIYGINGAARRLKLKPTTLQSKLKKLGVR